VKVRGMIVFLFLGGQSFLASEIDAGETANRQQNWPIISARYDAILENPPTLNWGHDPFRRQPGIFFKKTSEESWPKLTAILKASESR